MSSLTNCCDYNRTADVNAVLSNALGFPEISVVMCLYNSELSKALLTAASIVHQEGVTFEIILADDGSAVDITDLLKDYLAKNGFEGRIEVSRSPENRGTVLNIADAIKHVRAPYVKLISPGDCLYCKTTLATFVDSLEKTTADIAFGRAVYYSFNPTFKVFNITRPSFPEKYDTRRFGRSSALENILLCGDQILGVTMAFRTIAFASAIETLVGCVKYVEDNTSLVAILMDGGSIAPIDCFAVWYEYGSGISTGGDNRWKAVIAHEYLEFWNKMSLLYPESALIYRRRRMMQFVLGRNGVSSIRRAIWELLHPWGLSRLLRTIVARRCYKCTGYDRAFLDTYLDAVDKCVFSRAGE